MAQSTSGKTIAQQLLKHCDVETSTLDCNRALSQAFEQLIETRISLFSQKLQTSGETPTASEIDSQFTDLAASIKANDLGPIYEQLFLAKESNKTGAFYTPQPVVQLMVEQTISSWRLCQKSSEIDRLPSILDPSCGAGVFLLQAFECLVRGLKQSNISLPESLLSALDQLHGVDIDQKAVWLCRKALLLRYLELGGDVKVRESIEQKLNSQIVVGNSLTSPLSAQENILAFSQLKAIENSFDWQQSFPDIMRRGGFDCVLGNPPYGLARDRQLSVEENELLKLLYQELRCGKVNKYLLFIACGVKLLNHTGSLCFIVPNAWLGIQGGQKIRELLVKNHYLQEITHFQGSVFPQLGVETIIVHISKTAQAGGLQIIERDSEQLQVRDSTFVPWAALENAADYQISLNWNKASQQIFDQILQSSQRIGDPDSPFRAMIAIQAYATGKGSPAQSKEDVSRHIYHCQEKVDQSCLPYLEGADITRYQYHWSGSYLKYGPWLAEFQPLERFKGPRIAIREIINKFPYLLNATFIDQPYVYNKSVLHVLPKNPRNIELTWALLAILNSAFGGYWLMQRGRKSQRKLFPKLVNDDLKNWPIPRNFSECRHTLSEKARQITEALAQVPQEPSKLAKVWNHCRQSSCTAGYEEIFKLQSQLDHLVIECYGLSSAEEKQIMAAA